MLKNILSLILLFSLIAPGSAAAAQFWPVRSVDTMKYSRDLAQERLSDPGFDTTIDLQVKAISASGATHVALGTPYDEPFVPFLTRWVTAARKYGLKVWFRGNFAGWENWFGYEDISRGDHLSMTQKFITSHPDLFADGDIFTPCPECENGGPGDPRFTRDVAAYRRFIINLYQACTGAFARIDRSVACNYFSTNGDVARLIFDRQTAAEIDAVITVDHYVRSPKVLVSDLQTLARNTGARVVLGEFGAPVPDIHGSLTPEAQSRWLGETLDLLARTPEVVGLNYWTSFGGSTRLWEDSGSPRPGASVLTAYYSPRQITINLKNAVNQPIKSASAVYLGRTFPADSQGLISLPALSGSHQVEISSPDYQAHGLLIGESDTSFTVELTKTHESWLFRLHKLTYRILKVIIP